MDLCKYFMYFYDWNNLFFSTLWRGISTMITVLVERSCSVSNVACTAAPMPVSQYEIFWSILFLALHQADIQSVHQNDQDKHPPQIWSQLCHWVVSNLEKKNPPCHVGKAKGSGDSAEPLKAVCPTILIEWIEDRCMGNMSHPSTWSCRVSYSVHPWHWPWTNSRRHICLRRVCSKVL